MEVNRGNEPRDKEVLPETTSPLNFQLREAWLAGYVRPAYWRPSKILFTSNSCSYSDIG